jgi:hypothetical protein
VAWCGAERAQQIHELRHHAAFSHARLVPSRL